MGQKDIISKQLIQRIAVDLAVYLLGLKIDFDELELLSSENMRVEERRADLVAKVTQQGEAFILHIEIQNNNEQIMSLRMLRYYTDIALSYPGLPIRQAVIYIGKAALNMPAGKNDIGLDYQYNLIDMHTIDYQELLKQDSPDAIVLAILCDFKKDSDNEAVKNIVQLLHEKLQGYPKKFREYMYMLEVLSENRYLKTAIKEVEAVITNVKVEDLPSYELGMEKGEQIGELRGETKGVVKGEHKIIMLLLNKQPAEVVAELTGFSVEEILEIKRKYSH